VNDLQLTKRVAGRFVQALASKKLPNLIDPVLRAVAKEDWKTANDKYHDFLRAIGIFASPAVADRARISSPWAHNFTPSQSAEYERWIEQMMNIRDRLVRAAHPMPGEMPNPGDIEWDLGVIQHNFVEWVEPHFRDEDDEFKHGPFKVFLADDARDGLEEALKALDAASDKIRPKFPKVLYGKVFVTRGLKGGTYDKAPSRAGSYVDATDSINLSLYAVPDRDSIMTLIHEFGHRYHGRFLNYDLRQKFIQLSEVGDVQEKLYSKAERYKYADEYIERETIFREEDDKPNGVYGRKLSREAEEYFKAFSKDRDYWKTNIIPFKRKYREDKDDSVLRKLRDGLAHADLHQFRVIVNEDDLRPLAASPYGATKWEENFAECFLHFCIGKKLPDGLQNFMESL